MAGLFSPQINPIGTPPGVPDDGGSTTAAVGNVLVNALQAFKKSDPGTLSARQPTQDEISDAALKPFYAKALESQQLLESGGISALQHKTNLSVLSREVATMAPSMVDDFQGDMETILGINIKEENARVAALRDASDTANVGVNLAINYLEGGNENQKALMAAGTVAAANAGLNAEQTQAYLSGIAMDIAKREGEVAKVHAINDPIAKKRAIQELGRHLTPSLMGVVMPVAVDDPEKVAAIAGSGQGFSLYQNVEAGVNAVEQYWRNELTEAGIVYEDEDINQIMQPFRKKLEIFGNAVGRTLDDSKGIRTKIGQAAITALLSEEGLVGQAAERAYDEYMGWLASNDPAAMSNVSETLSKFIQEGRLPELLPVFQWTSEMIDTGQGSNLDLVLSGLFDNVEIRDGYRVALNTSYYYKEALHEADQFRKRRSQTAGTVLAAETFNRALEDDELNAPSLELVGDEVDELMTTETKKLPVAQQAVKDKVVIKINAAREVALERVNRMIVDAGFDEGEVRGVEVGASGLYTVAINPNGKLGKFISQFGLEPTYRNVDRAVALHQMRNAKGERIRIDPDVNLSINALRAMRPHIDKLNVIENKAQQWVDTNPGLSTANILSDNPARTPREQQIIDQADEQVEQQLQQPTGTVVNSNAENPAIVETVVDDPASTPPVEQRGNAMEDDFTLPSQVEDDGEFLGKLSDVAEKLGTTDENLLAIIAFETGNTFDPAQKNFAGGSATGLIQFMPTTAKSLGTTTEELASMSRTEQLDFVDKYLSQWKRKLDKTDKSIADLYMAVLWPRAIDKGDDYILWRKGTRAYEDNKGLDIGDKGYVTKADAAAKVVANWNKNYKKETA